MNSHYQENDNFCYASDEEWDRFDVELGAANNNNTDQQWILSDRDVWYINPLYTGPDQPHPEYDIDYEA